jgi:hypothetical protein
MEILRQIQADLLKPDGPLSSILRKAKVLASELHSDELRDWVSHELDGYESDDELPDYRIIRTACVGIWTNGHWKVENHGVPLHMIDDEKLRQLLTRYRVFGGIRKIERLATHWEQHFVLSPHITLQVNHYVADGGYAYVGLEYALGQHEFDQILDTVKNRLLDFVLTLNQTWHLDDNLPSKGELSNLVSVVIYNNPKGGNVSVFDQRGQQVSYQYNAAGDININAVSDKDGLRDQLEKLRAEVEHAKGLRAIDPDIAVESQYHLLQAAKEVQQKNPDKPSVIEHLSKAKRLLENVAAVGGLVTALLKAVEVADKIFR